MAVSNAYNQAIKNRTQRSRRIEVVLFFSFVAMGLFDAGHSWTWTNFGELGMPYLFVATQLLFRWKQQRYVPVTSLDDRAAAEYGVAFEQTTQTQQRELLDKYRVGTYLLNYFPDEFEQAQQREWYLHAYAALRILLPALAMIYWFGWKLIPGGRIRASWTDAPVILIWLSILILALPEVLRMWIEPSDPAEPTLAIATRKEA